ncbi:MAG: cupin domain-containing protein [Pseudomonadota bacterium]
MPKRTRRLLVTAAVLFGLTGSVAIAHPDHLDAGPDWTGTLAELFEVFAPDKAHASDFSGPTKPVGISAKTLGAADLTGELAGLDARELRARLWTMEPDGVVPVHSHVDRPAYVYVLEGEVTEYRSDDDKPHVFKAGDLSVEAGGVIHWWKNTGGTTVRLLAIDIRNTQ